MTNNNNNETKKVTKREYFAMLAEIVNASGSEYTESLVAFIDREVELLNQKYEKTKEKKSTGSNQKIKDLVMTVLEEKPNAVCVADLLEDSRLATYTNDKNETVKMSSPKLSAMISQLVQEGRLTKEIIKKRSYYSIA